MAKTKLTQQDLQIYPSQRLTDTADGGGLMVGTGIIAGRGIGIVTVGGVPAPRRILLLERERLKVIDDQWSAADGTYLFAELNTGQDFIVLALDHKRQYEPVARDYIRPVEDNP